MCRELAQFINTGLYRFGAKIFGGVFFALGLVLTVWDVSSLGCLSKFVGILDDLAPEFLGIGITVLVIDTANGWREIESEKRELIFKMGSENSITASDAVNSLRRYGWLYDGSLRGAKLRRACLINVNLCQAYMVGVDLTGADLVNADLTNADLRNSNLSLVDFRGADLTEVDLRGSDLKDVDFRDCDLTGAKYYPEQMGEVASLDGAILPK